MGLGRLGFAGGLGVLVRGSVASLGDLDFGIKSMVSELANPQNP